MKAYRSVTTVSRETTMEGIVKSVAGKIEFRKLMRDWFQAPTYPSSFTARDIVLQLESDGKRYALKLTLPEEKREEMLVLDDGVAVIEIHQRRDNWLPLERPLVLQAIIDDGLAPGTEAPFNRKDVKPLGIDEADVYELEPILSNEKLLRMPVIYMSSTYYGKGQLVDPEILQELLKGQAHIAYEKDSEAHRAMKALMEGNENASCPYNGTCEIVLSERHHIRFYLGNYTSPEEAVPLLVKKLQKHVATERRWNSKTFHSVQNARIRNDNSTLRNEKAELDAELSELRTRVRTKDDDEINDIFDKLTARLEAEHAEKERAVEDAERWKRALESIKTRNSASTISLELSEAELYPGEIKDSLLRIIQRAEVSLTSYGRLKDIATALLKENELTETGKGLETLIKEALTENVGMTDQRKRKLRMLGFDVSLNGNDHWDISTKDGRYSVSIANTPSDNRAGKNAAGNLIRIMTR